jgi:hypothetical protein
MKHTIQIKPGHYVQLDSYRREPYVPSIVYWGLGLGTTIMLVTAGIYGIENYSQQLLKYVQHQPRPTMGRAAE